jgi:hypothetical protein
MREWGSEGTGAWVMAVLDGRWTQPAITAIDPVPRLTFLKTRTLRTLMLTRQLCRAAGSRSEPEAAHGWARLDDGRVKDYFLACCPEACLPAWLGVEEMRGEGCH